jgi:isopenicillin N synthase-like dioxygenase
MLKLLDISPLCKKFQVSEPGQISIFPSPFVFDNDSTSTESISPSRDLLLRTENTEQNANGLMYSISYLETAKALLNELIDTGFVCITGFNCNEEEIIESIESHETTEQEIFFDPENRFSSNSQAIIFNAFQAAEQFFALPLEIKLNTVSLDKARRGYSPIVSENFSCLIGESKPNDLVEKFRIGPEIDFTEEASSSYFTSKSAKSFYHPNSWNEFSSKSKTSLLNYYKAMEKLTAILLEALEVSLNLPFSFFRLKMTKHTSILTMNYFPSMESLLSEGDKESFYPTGRHRISDHTDVSMLTIVAQSLCDAAHARLEILGNDGNWVTVPYVANSFVINVGDCLKDWTKGLLKSTKHRVSMDWSCIYQSAHSDPSQYPVNDGPPTYRYSLAYFVTPDFDCVIKFPEETDISVLSDANPLTYALWRKLRIQQALKTLQASRK